MPTFAEENIKEIADQLDSGFQAFYHRLTGELIFVPDPDKFQDFDEENWDEELKKLENHFDDYIKIEGMESTDSFQVMADFTNQLDDKISLKQQLISALNKRRPFREFKFIIDGSGIYRQQWFDFKNGRLKDWVKNQLEN